MGGLLALGNVTTSLCEKLPRRASALRRIFLGSGTVVRAAQLAIEPEPGVGPVTVRGGARDAEGLGRFLNGQPAEVTQGNELGLDWVFSRELGQGLIESQQV